MSEQPPLERAHRYRLEELLAVLGPPTVRKNTPPMQPGDTDSKGVSWTLHGDQTIDEAPAVGQKQVMVWHCDPLANDACFAFGDPVLDMWVAMRLCRRHGGVPYEEATIAGTRELVARAQWVSDFWTRLEELLGPLEWLGDWDVRAGAYRVVVAPVPADASIQQATNVGCKSWYTNAEGEEEDRFLGSFSVVNAPAREAAVEVVLTPFDGVVELTLRDEGNLRGRVVNDARGLVFTGADGNERPLAHEAIVAIRSAFPG